MNNDSSITIKKKQNQKNIITLIIFKNDDTNIDSQKLIDNIDNIKKIDINMIPEDLVNMYNIPI